MKLLRMTLLVLVVISWGVGISAILGFFPPIGVVFRAATMGVLVINILCGIWLFRNSGQNNIEWGLLGFLGNFNALLLFWIWRDFIPDLKERWRDGRQFFR
jgi:hypothetical protein